MWHPEGADGRPTDLSPSALRSYMQKKVTRKLRPAVSDSSECTETALAAAMKPRRCRKTGKVFGMRILLDLFFNSLAPTAPQNWPQD
jgi:hypothetical protein